MAENTPTIAIHDQFLANSKLATAFN